MQRFCGNCTKLLWSKNTKLLSKHLNITYFQTKFFYPYLYEFNLIFPTFYPHSPEKEILPLFILKILGIFLYIQMQVANTLIFCVKKLKLLSYLSSISLYSPLSLRDPHSPIVLTKNPFPKTLEIARSSLKPHCLISNSISFRIY